MFSILIKYNKSGKEVLLPARSVEFNPRGAKDQGLLINHAVAAEGGSHWGFAPEGEADWCDVFVMNANGKTVARYSL